MCVPEKEALIYCISLKMVLSFLISCLFILAIPSSAHGLVLVGLVLQCCLEADIRCWRLKLDVVECETTFNPCTISSAPHFHGN